jgi:hypothetical protein
VIFVNFGLASQRTKPIHQPQKGTKSTKTFPLRFFPLCLFVATPKDLKMQKLTKLLMLFVLLCLLSSTSCSNIESGTLVNDDAIGRAFANGASNIQVEGEGTVLRLLPDDLNAPRHQRFIVQLASGQTVLITHNIDIAPRIDALDGGDSVRFSGEYVWNAKGGVIHWTHHDPQGKHVAGWVIHNGKTYK